jgi:hypothetical protein
MGIGFLSLFATIGFGILAIIFGLWGLARSRKGAGRRGIAIAGLLLGLWPAAAYFLTSLLG